MALDSSKSLKLNQLLAGAGEFDPPTTGFRVLRWPFCPVILSPISYGSVAKLTGNLSVPYPSMLPHSRQICRQNIIAGSDTSGDHQQSPVSSSCMTSPAALSRQSALVMLENPHSIGLRTFLAGVTPATRLMSWSRLSMKGWSIAVLSICTS